MLADWATTAEWVVHHWYWPALFACALFAYGLYQSWQGRKHRAKLDDASLANKLGGIYGAGGTTQSYNDAELPDPRLGKPPRPNDR